MHCAQVQELLSAFHDNELEPEMHRAIEEHLNECPTCRERLRELRQISLATRRLPEPIPPEELREKIEQRRAAEIEALPAPLLGRRRKNLSRAVPFVAAAVVLLIGIAIWVTHRDNDGERQAAADMSLFLVDYRKHPEQAQKTLAAKYDGRRVDLREAEREVHYLPAATKTLPGSLSLKQVYLLKMPCCLCVQSIYERPDKGLLVIFEHTDDEPEWFDDRPAIKAICNSKPTSIVQCDSELAVTWKGKKRFVTIVGARSLEEIAILMGSLDDRAEANHS